MHVTGVGLLLLEEVVDSGLDVFSEGGGGEPLGRERVLFPLRSTGLVAVITNEPEEISGQISIAVVWRQE